MSNTTWWILHASVFLIIIGFIVAVIVSWRLSERNRRLNADLKDVTEQYKSAAMASVTRSMLGEMETLGMIDYLTGLLNRTVFMRQLDEVLDASEITIIVVVVINIGGLPGVNEAFGVEKGDQFLRDIAGILKRNVEQGIMAREGNQFMIAMKVNDRRGVNFFVQKMLGEIRGIELLQDSGIIPDVSVGIAFYPEHGDDGGCLVKRAGMAVEESRRVGRHYFYSEEMEARLGLEREIQQCLLRRADGLELYFQVIVDAQTEQMVSLEVLARWHCNGQFVMPGVFIPMIDKLRLYSEFDEVILSKACEQAVIWGVAGFVVPQISVNFSKFSLERLDFASFVRKVIGECGVPASFFGVELLESHRMDNSVLSRVVAELLKLKDDGMKVSIDDFGGGDFRVPLFGAADVLKIDMSMTAQITSDPQVAQIMEQTINIAHALGKEVVAEGVETLEQLEKLCELGCDMVQGFLFSRPLPADQIAALRLKKAK